MRSNVREDVQTVPRRIKLSRDAFFHTCTSTSDIIGTRYVRNAFSKLISKMITIHNLETVVCIVSHTSNVPVVGVVKYRHI